jgi:glycosyltransferase involved in cell wall biosynthesis
VDNEKNLGLVATLNRGLRLAGTELIARQDADDLSDLQRLERQVAFLKEHPEVALVGTQATLIDESGRYLRTLLDRPCSDLGIRWDLLFDNSFIHTSVMFRNEIILDQLGGYDPSYLAFEDYDLWSRVAQVSQVANLRSRLVQHRKNPDSKRLGTQEAGKIRDLARVIRRNVEILFGKEFLSGSDIELLASFSCGYKKELEVRKFVDLFDRLIEEYARKFPEAVTTPDFKRAVRRRYLKLVKNEWKTFIVYPKYWTRHFGWFTIGAPLVLLHVWRILRRIFSASRISGQHGSTSER